MIVSIDPGFSAKGQGCAVAAYSVGKRCVLEWVGYLDPDYVDSDKLRSLFGAQVKRVIWECPQVDQRARHSTQNIVKLAAVGGTLAGMIAGACGGVVRAAVPSEWKGAIPKPIHHRRFWDILTSEERLILGGATTDLAIATAQRKGGLDRWAKGGAHYYGANNVHNLLDAAALGGWAVGRMKL